MRDEDDGDLLAMNDMVNRRVDCVFARAIKSGSSFVQEKDAGFPDERSSDSNYKRKPLVTAMQGVMYGLLLCFWPPDKLALPTAKVGC